MRLVSKSFADFVRKIDELESVSVSKVSFCGEKVKTRVPGKSGHPSPVFVQECPEMSSFAVGRVI